MISLPLLLLTPTLAYSHISALLTHTKLAKYLNQYLLLFAFGTGFDTASTASVDRDIRPCLSHCIN